MSTPSIVALIPARAGSKRIKGKNTRDFFGHPLIAYTIAAAKESGIFQQIIVCSDVPEHEQIAYASGCAFRGRAPVPDDQPDIACVRDVLQHVTADAFAILRPTSPFRTASMIRNAYGAFRRISDHVGRRCLRAVEPVRQHPGKMWDISERSGRMFPILTDRDENARRLNGVPWHSCPTQALPTYFIQNASLEMADVDLVLKHGVICTDYPLAFITEGYEGFDFNTERDWADATSLVNRGLVTLPTLGPQTPAAPSLT